MTSTARKIYALFSAAIVAVGLFGCTSGLTWTPGRPDETTVDIYRAAMVAIEAKSKLDARTALHLLRNDVTRMNADTVTIQEKLAGLDAVSDAVDREDWDAARNRLLALKSGSGQP